MGYWGLEWFTKSQKGYKVLQGVKGVTRGYKGLEWVGRGYKLLPGVTAG